jgi:hypothetical protein
MERLKQSFLRFRLRAGHGDLFSKIAYAYLISWNGSEALHLCFGQPLKGLFVVALAFTACMEA